MEKPRTVVFIVLIVIGAGLLVYGLHFHAVVSGGQGQTLASSEMAITQEVARGGVKREESGEIKKTSEGTEKTPAACPT